jgi:hypothetical protein
MLISFLFAFICLMSRCEGVEPDWPAQVKFGLVNGRVIDRRSDGIVFDLVGPPVEEYRFSKGFVVLGTLSLVAVEDGELSMRLSFSEFFNELKKFRNEERAIGGVLDVRRFDILIGK